VFGLIQNVEELVSYINGELISAEIELKKFRDNFEKSPAYAFEWSDSAITASQTLKELTPIRDRLLKVINDRTEDDLNRRDVVVNMRRTALRNVVQFSTGTSVSTSPSTNLTNDARLHVWAELVDALAED
jgi:hypothetical protein